MTKVHWSVRMTTQARSRMSGTIVGLAASTLTGLCGPAAYAVLLIEEGFPAGGASPAAGEYASDPDSLTGANGGVPDGDSILFQGPAGAAGFDASDVWDEMVGVAQHVYPRVLDAGLNYTDSRGNQLTTAGGAVDWHRDTAPGAGPKLASRNTNLPVGAGDELPEAAFFSALMQFTSGLSGQVEFHQLNRAFVFGFDAGGRVQVATQGAGEGGPVAGVDVFAAGTTHLVFGVISNGPADSVSIWVNPADLSDPMAGAASLTSSAFGSGWVVNPSYTIDALHLTADLAGGDQYIFDEVRVGETAGDVLPYTPPQVEVPTLGIVDYVQDAGSVEIKSTGTNTWTVNPEYTIDPLTGEPGWLAIGAFSNRYLDGTNTSTFDVPVPGAPMLQYRVRLTSSSGSIGMSAAQMGFSAAGSDIAHWASDHVSRTLMDATLRITAASASPGYGRVDSPELVVDVDQHPFLSILIDHDPQQDHGWTVAVNNQTPLTMQQYTRKTGVATFDLRDKTGFTGEQTFFLSLYVVGQGKTVDVRWIGIADQPLVPSYPPASEPGGAGYLLYSTLPFTVKTHVDLPQPVEVGRAMSVFAAPGEYEPASFSIHAGEDLTGVAVRADPLLDGQGHTIPAEAVDIRTVKVWYQGGSDQEFGEVVLVPELLLKDDGLIEADTVNRRNILHFTNTFLCGFSQTPTRIPMDGPDFQPVNVPAYTSREFWLTVHVPEATVPGVYTSTVHVEPANAPAGGMDLRVTVLPIELREPEQVFSIYDYSPSGMYCSQDPAGALLELMDIRAHGLGSAFLTGYYIHTRVETNANGEWSVDLAPLTENLEHRVQAGLTGPTVLSLDNYVAWDVDFRSFWSGNDSAENVDKVTDVVQAIEQLVDDNGYPELYYYGIDEPTGDNLPKCRRIFEVIRNAGGKTTTAVYTDTLAAELSPYLDMPIYGIMQEQLYVNPVQQSSYPLQLNYWHPLENPNVDRFRYGVFVWRSGLDGSAPYAYRNVYQGDPYHDESTGQTDSFSYQRNSMYTYPSQVGPIPTIQWEAVREGIDDVRYLTTLDEVVTVAAGQAGSPALQAEIDEANALLSDLPAAFDGTVADITETLQPGDFRDYRLHVARQIVRLQLLLDGELFEGSVILAELDAEVAGAGQPEAPYLNGLSSRAERFRRHGVQGGQPSGTNLVRNPGFEQVDGGGSVVDWVLVKDPGNSLADTLAADGATWSIIPPGQGGKTARMEILSNHARSSGVSQENIGVVGGATYHFSLKHVEKAVQARNLFVAIDEYDVGGNDITGEGPMSFRGEPYLAINVSQSSHWTLWSKSVTTRPDTVEITITIYPNGVGTAWFDDVSLVRTDLP